MPKGRRCMPRTEQDGNWFQQLGLPNITERGNTGTTTGIMLNDVFNERSKTLTKIRCPPNYLKREQQDYMTENPFSWHDNRNSFQDHGIYFRQGLGKKKALPDVSQHKSDDIVTWGRRMNPEAVLNMKSLYREDFLGDRCTTAPSRRRYPNTYRKPSPGPIDTKLWVEDKLEVPRTYLQTLANAQEPYLPPNTWRYSYHAQSFAAKPRTRTRKEKRSKTLTVR